MYVHGRITGQRLTAALKIIRLIIAKAFMRISPHYDILFSEEKLFFDRRKV
jgi:hypothetical protein